MTITGFETKYLVEQFITITMKISEFEKLEVELKNELVKRYRLENGKRFVNFLDKQETDQFYLWLKMKDDGITNISISGKREGV